MKAIAAVLPSPSNRVLCKGACDTHNHVFGPFDRFPLQYPPDYPVPLAPVETYLRMLDGVGLERGVLVQPTQQGRRNEILLDALRRAGNRLRGVAAVRADAEEEQLEEMQRAGVIGLRFVEAPLPGGAPRPGAVGFEEIVGLSSRLRSLDWSIHVWARLPTLLENLQKLLEPQVPVVFEHLGMLEVAQGSMSADFQRMLSLVREGRVWVKLSLCRCSTAAPHYADLRPFVDALVEANPDRLLWASDWPFIRMEGKEPDCGALLDLFCEWIDDREIRHRILVENPERLFGFERRVLRSICDPKG